MSRRNEQDRLEFRLALMATKPPRDGHALATASGFSAAVNIGVIALLLWVTGSAAQREPPPLETVAFMRLESEPPAPVPPPPPMLKAAPVSPMVQSDVPLGFQTLTAPTIVPPDIPAPRVGNVVNEADFSGVGVEGGRSTGMAAQRSVTSEDVSAAPAFTPHTVAPELANREEVARALVTLYPRLLRDAGVGGTVLVWFFIDREGRVLRSLVKEGSGHAPLDEAALQVADVMRFTPAWNRDRKVPVWIAIPIEFSAK